MRRKDRQVVDQQDIHAIMERCDVCHIALMDGQYPYIVTMNFGMLYQEDRLELYFHCAQEGKKLDLIRNDPHAAFEMDCSHCLVKGDKASGYTMEFESVCGTGILEILPPHKRMAAMTLLLHHYADNPPPLGDKDLVGVCILQLTVREITAKRLLKQKTV